MIFARPYKFLRNGGYTRSSNKKEECICLENTMQKTGLRRGLTTAQLKWIALVLMVLDHIHYFFEFTGAVPLLFSQLGRLSAGLFLFCLIEGFIHTHDRRRYFLRIYLVSVGMGAVQFCCILFDFCRRPDGFYPMNQMLATFAVLLPMLQGVDWLRQKRWLRGLAALVLPFAWPFFMLMVIYPMFPQAEGWLTLLGFTVLPMHTMIMDGGTLPLSGTGPFVSDFVELPTPMIVTVEGNKGSMNALLTNFIVKLNHQYKNLDAWQGDSLTNEMFTGTTAPFSADVILQPVDGRTQYCISVICEPGVEWSITPKN